MKEWEKAVSLLFNTGKASRKNHACRARASPQIMAEGAVISKSEVHTAHMLWSQRNLGSHPSSSTCKL